MPEGLPKFSTVKESRSQIDFYTTRTRASCSDSLNNQLIHNGTLIVFHYMDSICTTITIILYLIGLWWRAITIQYSETNRSIQSSSLNGYRSRPSVFDRKPYPRVMVEQSFGPIDSLAVLFPNLNWCCD